MSSWPRPNEYAMAIEYQRTNDPVMETDQPHIVSFMRPSGASGVTIEFLVHDDQGQEVVGPKSITLSPTSGASSGRTCVCTGDNGQLNTTKFGDDYGKWCDTWDAYNCDFLWPGVE